MYHIKTVISDTFMAYLTYVSMRIGFVHHNILLLAILLFFVQLREKTSFCVLIVTYNNFHMI